MESFKNLVAAVQENNDLNEGFWSDWENAEHIQLTYGNLKDYYKEISTAFLNALIRDNGDNVEIYIDTMECLHNGFAYARNKQ